MVKKVLIVDDVKDIVYVLRTALEIAGYNVATAFDGKEAWDKIVTEKPDLIVLDIMLPQIDGITLNSQLKSNDDTKTIPVVVITGWAQHREILTAYAATRVTEFIEKPFQVKYLLDRIKTILNSAPMAS